MEKDLRSGKKNKTDLSKHLGEILAKRASEKKISKVSDKQLKNSLSNFLKAYNEKN